MGWGLGLLMWNPGELAAEFAEIPFEVDAFLLPLSLGILAAIAVGFLRGFLLPRPTASVMLVALGLALAYWANFTSFGGFCLDAGDDVCIVGAQAHAAGLLVPMAALAAGLLTEAVARMLRSQETRGRRA